MNKSKTNDPPDRCRNTSNRPSKASKMQTREYILHKCSKTCIIDFLCKSKFAPLPPCFRSLNIHTCAHTHRHTVQGACGLRSSKPPCFPGRAVSPPDLPPGGQGPPHPLCAQARSDRTAREHEARLARNMMSNHTDMQDKYCGHRYDIHPIQSQLRRPLRGYRFKGI